MASRASGTSRRASSNASFAPTRQPWWPPLSPRTARGSRLQGLAGRSRSPASTARVAACSSTSQTRRTTRGASTSARMASGWSSRRVRARWRPCRSAAAPCACAGSHRTAAEPRRTSIPPGRGSSARAGTAARITRVSDGATIALPHPGAVQFAAFSPDGQARRDRRRRRDRADLGRGDGRRRAVLPAAGARLASVRFDEDGERVVASGADGVVRVSSVGGGPPLDELRGAGPGNDARVRARHRRSRQRRRGRHAAHLVGAARSTSASRPRDVAPIKQPSVQQRRPARRERLQPDGDGPGLVAGVGRRRRRRPRC